MAVGLHAVNLANKWLDMLRAVAFTAPASANMKLHTGDPGSAGTSAASAETLRKVITFSAAGAGALAATATFPSWTAWSAGAETISHATVWDNITAGVFLYSFAWTVAKAITNGDTLNVTAHSVTLTPLAA